MEIEAVATILAELGNPVRLRVIRLLVQAGKGGVPVGRIQAELGIPASTLSHHLSRLKAVDLIRQQRERTTLWCVMDYERLEAVMAFLTKECCFGLPPENSQIDITVAELSA